MTSIRLAGGLCAGALIFTVAAGFIGVAIVSELVQLAKENL
jgi:F0F1-type ATP synthase membrane subunit a